MMWLWNTPTTNSSPLQFNPESVERGRAVIKTSWIQDKDKTIERELLHACHGNFGTAKHHYSFTGHLEGGQPLTNNLYLPADDEIPDAYWPLFSKTAPVFPDHRTLVVHVSRPVGRSLIHAKTPWMLMLSIGHSMLGELHCQLYNLRSLKTLQDGLRCV